METSLNNRLYNENSTVEYRNYVSSCTSPWFIALVHFLELALIGAVLVILTILVTKVIDKLLKPAEEEGQSSNIPVEDDKSQTLVNGDRMKDECTICLGGFDDTKDKVAVLKPCEHVFHVDCISKWVPRNRSCPICRREAAKMVLCSVQIESASNDSALDMV